MYQQKENKNRYRLKHSKAVKIYFIVFTYIFLPFWFPARRWHMTIPLLIGKDYDQARALKSEDRDISRLSCTMSNLIFQWSWCWKERSKTWRWGWGEGDSKVRVGWIHYSAATTNSKLEYYLKHFSKHI